MKKHHVKCIAIGTKQTGYVTRKSQQIWLNKSPPPRFGRFCFQILRKYDLFLCNPCENNFQSIHEFLKLLNSNLIDC